MNKINILLAEDQTMLLNALATILDLEDNLHVVQSCANGKQAFDYIQSGESERVDIVLTDIEMPDMTGLELAKQLFESKVPCKTIILTTFARSGYLRRAMDSGVKGYLLKDSPSQDLIDAIQKVHQGGTAIAPELMVESWMEKDPLSDKERHALRLAKDGLSTEDIAKKLFLSTGTVRNYLSSASSKLNAKNRIEAARIAHQNGWL
ncbi:response regulator transcription factor [Paraglaciecola arctica]|jgi:two-component system response regulator DesR|uniref:LuxR family two-component response regulator n=1 Tax=Paraglaciecola arctica BSs20135 TaxID=493475 RepID=K6ZEC4_9ALTE|nr:response regulator transcription factor [Paraglaciecola arctica]GAC21760.1 LuxR family two-component response regulator [Paraglaciecola arctica BSs20135]